MSNIDGCMGVGILYNDGITGIFTPFVDDGKSVITFNSRTGLKQLAFSDKRDEKHFLENEEISKVIKDGKNSPFSFMTQKEIENTIYETKTEKITVFNDSCNLSCRNCSLGEDFGSRFHIRRDGKRTTSYHLSKLLDYLTSRKLIDEKNIALSYWGGEPIMDNRAFKWFKEMNDIFLKKTRDKSSEPSINVTTNAIYLPDEVISYIVDNGIKVALSLNGTKEMHNSERIFKNGTGTHDIVMENLKRIFEYSERKSPDYFGKKVVISAVYSPEHSIREFVDFFENEPIVSAVENFIVRPKALPEGKRYKPEEIKRYEGELYKLQLEYLLSISKNEKKSPIRDALLKPEFFRRGNAGKSIHGSCIPPNRIALRPNGEINQCYIDSSLPKIGNADNKEIFDYDAMIEASRSFVSRKKEMCGGKCPFVSACSRCPSSLPQSIDYRGQEQLATDLAYSLAAINLEGYRK